jgi:hypothetical protein
MNLFSIFLLFSLIQAYSAQYFVKHSDQCSTWADVDGECALNAPFMWAQCFQDCVDFAKNTHEMCDTWATEGECTKNPSFIHINCPRSCNMAVSWNPWVRRELGRCFQKNSMMCLQLNCVFF